MSIAKVNWPEIEKKYVFGIEQGGKYHFPSYGELGREYDLAPSTIMRRSKKEGWELKREAFRNKNKNIIEETKKQRRNNMTAENATMQRNDENVAQDSAGITQDDINEHAEAFSKQVLDFDRNTAQIAEKALKAIRFNLEAIEKQIDDPAKQADGSTFKADMIHDNMKALEVAQKVFKNAIGEALPQQTDNKITIEVVPSRAAHETESD